MSGHISKRRDVFADLKTIAVHLGKDRPNTAIRFLAAAEKAFSLLADFPLLGSAYPSPPVVLQGLRHFTIRRFRSIVFYYRPIEDGVEIVRVLHGARQRERLLGGEELH
jgi:toxin ParE1/3/4